MLRAYLESKPVFSGFLAAISGWTGATWAWLEHANVLIAALGATFGTIGAFFGMLIAIRKWLKEDK